MKYILTILLTIFSPLLYGQLRIDSLAVNRIKARNATQVTFTDSLKIQKGTAILYIQPKTDSTYLKSNKPISIQGIPTKKALSDSAHNLRVEIATKYAGLPDQAGHTGHFLQSNGLSESWQEAESTYTAENGDTVISGKIGWGGALTRNTSIKMQDFGIAFDNWNGAQRAWYDFQAGGFEFDNYASGNLNKIGSFYSTYSGGQQMIIAETDDYTNGKNSIGMIRINPYYLDFVTTCTNSLYSKTIRLDSLGLRVNSLNDTTYTDDKSFMPKDWIKKHAGGGVALTDDLLDFSINKYTKYSSKQSGFNFYQSAETPNNTDTLKFNGLLEPTGFVGKNSAWGSKLEIKTNSEEYPFSPIFRLRQKNNLGVEKTVFDFGNANAFQFNCMNRNATPFFYLTWADSSRFYVEGYYTKIGDIVRNNYWKFWYNGKLEQIINNVTKLTIQTDGMIKIGNDTVPVRKQIAADTASLSGRIGDTFIDTSSKYWYNTRNGRGGWIKLNYIIPFAILFRRKYLKTKIS